MANLTERLLDPETFEEALETYRFVKDPILLAYAQAIRELHRRLATAKAEGAAEALEGVAAEAEAFFPEYAKRKRDRAAAIRKGLTAQASAVTAEVKEDLTPLIALDRQYLAGLQQGYIWGLAGEGEKYAEACAARAEQIRAARSPGPGKCECQIERDPSRMSAAALESGASAEIVGPLCAYCKAANQPRRDTTVKKGTPA